MPPWDFATPPYEPRPTSSVKTQTALFLAACATVLSFQPARAVVYTFDPGHTPGTPSGGTGAWDTEVTNAVWATGGIDSVWANVVGDTATFAGTAGTVTLGATVINVDAINFNTTGYTITGGTLNFTGATPTITHTSGVSATLNSMLTGTAGLVVASTGTLTINNAANTLSGGIKITSGTLATGTTGSFGSNLITLDGGALRLTANISNNLAVTKTSTIDISGTTATVTVGTLTIGNQTLNIGTGSSAGTNGNVSFGATTLTGNATITNAKGTSSQDSGINATFGTVTVGDSVAANTTTTFTVNSGTSGVVRSRQMALDGSLSDNATDSTKKLALTVGGGNSTVTVNVGGVNTYTGATTVAAGSAEATLRLTTGHDRLPTGTNLTLVSGASSGGVLDLNGFNQTVASLTSANAARLGRVTNRASGTGISILTVNSDVTDSIFAGNLADGATAKVALTKAGSASMTLSAANAYTGGTIINGGTLTASGGSSAGGSGTGTWATNTNVITVNSVTGLAVGQRVSGTGIGAGSIIRGIDAGTNTLTLSSNTSAVGSSAAVTFGAYSSLGSGSVTVNGGTLSVTGSLVAASAVTVNSGGILRGTGTVGGVTTLNSGSILSAGISNANFGTLTFSDSLTAGTGVTVSLKLNSESGFIDQIAANGLTLSGATLSLVDLGETALELGLSFTIVNNTSASSVAGTFAGLNQGDTITVGANTYQITYDGGSGNDVVITTALASIPEPSTCALIGGALILGAACWRSRKQRS